MKLAFRASGTALILIAGLFLVRTLCAQQEAGAAVQTTMGTMADKSGMQKEDSEHGFPHPFLAHMGIADMPGMVSLRASGYRQYMADNLSLTDFAFHLEAGLFSRLGLHVRNDDIKQDPRTDIMLMYTFIENRAGDSGLSVFGALEIPSGAIPMGEDKVVGAFGVSGRKVFGDIAILDADVHYMPQMKMAEYEACLVLKASTGFFPVIEAGGETMPGATTLYVLPGLKFKLAKGKFLGVGTQIGLTSIRDFDTRVLLQLDMDW
jgi:hypothetical protein